MHSSDDAMEDEIASDVSDSQATAAAEKVVEAEQQETDEAPPQNSAQQIQKEAPTPQDIQAAEQASAKDVNVTKLNEQVKKIDDTVVKAVPSIPKQNSTQELSVSTGKQLEGIDEVSALDKAAREKH